jgi:hypothetical protein
MSARSALALMLGFIALAALPACVATVTAPEATAQEGDPAAPAEEAKQEPASAPALSDEDRAALELVRRVLAEDGRPTRIHVESRSTARSDHEYCP